MLLASFLSPANKPPPADEDNEHDVPPPADGDDDAIELDDVELLALLKLLVLLISILAPGHGGLAKQILGVEFFFFFFGAAPKSRT